MPITYSINETDEIIVEVWRGDISIAELGQYWCEYLKDKRVLALRRTLVDLRDAGIKFTAEELAATVKEVVIPALGGRDWITAMVVRSLDQFRASSQYQVFAKFYSYDSIFSDVATATNWLLRQQLKVS